MIINNKRFVSTILLLATTAVSFATATANKKKPLAFSSVLARSLQGSGACDTEAEHSKIYEQLQARYNDNCVQTDNSSLGNQGDIDMEWYCIKTYGNGIIDAVTYRAYDPTGKAFIPFSYETEGGDPNSPISTAIAMHLFEDPCNAFAEYNGDFEPPDADTICGNQDAHDLILAELQETYDNNCKKEDIGMGWDWYCSLSYGNGKQQSVIYETWTDGQDFMRPYSIQFSQGSPSEGTRVEKQFFENVCDEYHEYHDFEYEFKNPPAPEGCDYEEVNNKVLKVIDSFFEGDKYCTTTTDASYVYRECKSPFGYIVYSAIRPPANGFSASGPAIPDDVWMGLTDNNVNMMNDPAAVWEKPCDAAENIWGEILRTLIFPSNWYHDDHDDEVHAYGSSTTATATSSSSSLEDLDFASYTVEDVIDGFGANWFQDYPATLSKAAKEDSVDDADVVITGQNDVVVTPSGNITSAPQVDTDVSDGDKVSVSSAAVTRAPVLVLAAAALVAVVGAIL